MSNLQDFWNSQFKFSDILPDFAGSLERMEQASLAASQTMQLDQLSYGQDPRQWVEWTRGHGAQDILPVILHGGYWRALTAQMHRFMMPSFLGAGCAVANVEYRLMPHVRLADVVSDARLALHQLADAFPDAQLLPIGHSAGAHLSLCALEDPRLRPRILGIIALSGVYDLSPLPQSFLQAELQLTAQEIAAFSLHPSPDRPPVLYVNGSAETHEFQRGGAHMASEGRAAWHLIDGADHMSLTQAACDQAGHLLTSLFALEDET